MGLGGMGGHTAIKFGWNEQDILGDKVEVKTGMREGLLGSNVGVE